MVVKRKTNPRINTRDRDTRPRTIYRNYLKTQYWKEVRKQVLIRDKKMCQHCGSKTKLQIHHLSYANVFNELMHLNEVVTVCDKCHKAIHQNRKIK